LWGGGKVSYRDKTTKRDRFKNKRTGVEGTASCTERNNPRKLSGNLSDSPLNVPEEESGRSGR